VFACERDYALDYFFGFKVLFALFFFSFFLSRLLLLLPLAGVGAVAETLCLLQHLQQMLT
jgi:hypothetical protein